MNEPIKQDLTTLVSRPLYHSHTDYYELDDVDPETVIPSWIGTEIKLQETPQEELERKLAIQEQIKMGILDKLGIPLGFTYDELRIPEHLREQIDNARKNINPQPVAITNNVKPEFKSKFERQKWRQDQKELQRKQQKLFDANQKILMHQNEKPIANNPFINKK